MFALRGFATSSTMEPPPRPMDTTSGMRKFVRTPPMVTATPLSRGKPCASTPRSVVVPPTSMTMASSRRDR